MEGSGKATRVEAKPPREAAMRQVGMTWPVDENGHPMAVVSYQASDLVPTVQFGNVTLGPAMVMRPCQDREEMIRETMADCQRIVEQILYKERDLILDATGADPERLKKKYG